MHSFFEFPFQQWYFQNALDHVRLFMYNFEDWVFLPVKHPGPLDFITLYIYLLLQEEKIYKKKDIIKCGVYPAIQNQIVETDTVLCTYLIIMLIPAYRIWIHEIFSSFLYPWGTARSIWIMFTPPVVTYNQATKIFACTCTNDFKHGSYNIELFAFNIVTLI